MRMRAKSISGTAARAAVPSPGGQSAATRPGGSYIQKLQSDEHGRIDSPNFSDNGGAIATARKGSAPGRKLLGWWSTRPTRTPTTCAQRHLGSSRSKLLAVNASLNRIIPNRACGAIRSRVCPPGLNVEGSTTPNPAVEPSTVPAPHWSCMR
jgi:hypothetical protein